MNDEAPASVLRFQHFSSSPDVTFWHELSKRKLDVYQLSEDAIPLVGSYRAGSQRSGMPALLGVSSDSFLVESPQLAATHYPATGMLHNCNTVETFRELDKPAIFSAATQSIWDDIMSGRAEANPSLLCRFFVLSYSDLKKYKFYYWFAFPALQYPGVTCRPPLPIAALFSPTQLVDLGHKASQLRDQHLADAGFFLVKGISDGETVTVAPLLQRNDFWAGDEDVKEKVIAVADPGGLEDHPAWTLRNLLYMVGHLWQWRKVTILLLRDCLGTKDFSDSLVLRVTLPEVPIPSVCGKSAGWEKNEKGKLGHRMVRLGASMDPAQLATTAVDLNLKLMRWRLAPSLDLARVASTKCLLLGAGTLGCNVARALLGWGVRHLTFVDNGTVSFSNPVRQTLFRFEDCLNGGRPKAEAAADAVKQIFPQAEATGHRMTILMPGHPVSKSAQVGARKDFDTLNALVESHDVVFLLTDSREARWMGTVLAAAHDKPCINSALGFDSYVVMRHGCRAPDTPQPALGCYFCNDVIAPSDSLRERTLDQQCTVTRPGVSFMAAALAAELMVSLRQHAAGHAAPADTGRQAEGFDVGAATLGGTAHPLGLVPHQVRGFLGSWSQAIVTGHAYDQCTACSAPVLEAFARDGFDFVLRVCGDSSVLEDITGLTAMKQDAIDNPIDFDLADDDSWGI